MNGKRKKTIYEKFFKRTIDIILSFLLILILSPLLFILAIIVKIKLGSPIIFKQQRVGKDGKVFWIYKFRSMSNTLDESGNLLPDEKRLSNFGLKLRRSSLDELSQLFNILKGDMSFIGPRPKLVIDYAFMDDQQKQIYQVRPGLSGLSQVSGRNDLNWFQTFDIDNKYVSKVSFYQDFKIFFKTFGVVIKKKGISHEGMLTTEPFGKYLLRNNKISNEEYKNIIKKYNIVGD